MAPSGTAAPRTPQPALDRRICRSCSGGPSPSSHAGSRSPEHVSPLEPGDVLGAVWVGEPDVVALVVVAVGRNGVKTGIAGPEALADLSLVFQQPRPNRVILEPTQERAVALLDLGVRVGEHPPGHVAGDLDEDLRGIDHRLPVVTKDRLPLIVELDPVTLGDVPHNDRGVFQAGQGPVQLSTFQRAFFKTKPSLQRADGRQGRQQRHDASVGQGRREMARRPPTTSGAVRPERSYSQRAANQSRMYSPTPLGARLADVDTRGRRGEPVTDLALVRFGA